MMDLQYISEGCYRCKSTGNEYMSIWTFKQHNGMGRGTNEINYADAKRIKCLDKHWMPFTQSENFKSGWIYNVNDLNEFYNK